MKQRILTAVLLILCLLPSLVFGGILMDILIVLFALIGLYELNKLISDKIDLLLYIPTLIFFVFFSLSAPQYLLLILLVYVLFVVVLAICNEKYEFKDLALQFIFIFVVAFAIRGLIYIYDTDIKIMFFILLATYMCDTGAYFTGYFFGKHKLIPRVSPKKTIEGAIGGWIFGFASSLIYAYYFMNGLYDIKVILVLSIILPVVAQIGDLSFSLLKRTYGVKDFGNLFPGHGGVLDRIDSLLWCLVVFEIVIGVM